MDEECNLCKAQHQNYRLILEDEHTFAIICKWPLKPSHVMVLPKKHITELENLTKEETKSLLDISYKMAQAITKTYGKDCIILQNYGSHSSMPHIHFHILPSEGNLHDLFSPYENIPRRDETSNKIMEKYCKEIKENI